MSEDFDWNTIEPPDPIDPHDTLADPERHARVSTQVNERERAEREADAFLSDFGAVPLHQMRMKTRIRGRRDEE